MTFAPVLPIVETVHGSQLHGTSTPQSDRDYKGVHIPSAEGILLQRPERVLDLSLTSKSASGKNTAEAIDRESYALQKFCEMLAAGDTVATEILFTPDEFIVRADSRWPALREQLKDLLNSDCKGFVGYCMHQAAKYGVKGSRMAAVEGLVELLDEAIAKHGGDARTHIISEALYAFAEENEHAEIVQLDKPHGGKLEHIKCCERTMPFTGALKLTAHVYRRIWENYGERARAARQEGGIDWKAMSHAVRVARQARELMLTRNIVFPRPDAEELLAIKTGKLPFAGVQELLERLVDELEDVPSVLPARPEDDEIQAAIDNIVLPWHAAQFS